MKDKTQQTLGKLMTFLTAMPWKDTGENLRDYHENVLFELDVSESGLTAPEINAIFAEDPNLMDMVACMFIRIHLNDFREVAGCIFGGLVEKEFVTIECSPKGTLYFTVHPVVIRDLDSRNTGYGSGKMGQKPPPEFHRHSRHKEISAPALLSESEGASPVPEERVEEEESPEWRPEDPLRDMVEAISIPTPAEMNEQLQKMGYFGQESARRAACLFAYRHLKRIWGFHVDRLSLDQLPPKENLLLSGPTGCGKTYLLETLFNRILKLPVAIVDVSSITKTGFIGPSASILPEALIKAAHGNIYKASIGIICMDEFDKILFKNANKGLHASMEVQQELLRMIEGADLFRGEHGEGTTQPFSTHFVPFIASGAFSGIEKIERRLSRSHRALGFGATETFEQNQQALWTDVLQQYGFLPELVGRFGRFAKVEPIGPKLMGEILEEQVLKRYREECAREGTALHVSSSAKEELLRQNQRFGLGVRALSSQLNSLMENACYEAFSRKEGAKEISLRMQNGSLAYRVRG